MPIKGDFISFSYNGVHSTELGIVHVSSSDRYADALLPTIQDKTVLAPGSDGTYFFGSYYTQRPITINIAFDSVTEALLRKIRNIFGDKLSHNLVFDDEPYKVYLAKVTGTPQYNYICFGSPRVYKGEGTLTFTCYEPFAHCPNLYKYLSLWNVVPDTYVETEVTQALYEEHWSNYYILVDDKYVKCKEEDEYNSEATYYVLSAGYTVPDWYKYDNKAEWNLSAGLLVTLGTHDIFTSNKFELYNPGDLESNFKFKIPISASIGGIKIDDGNNHDLESHILMLNGNTITPKGNDAYLLFNSRTNLIEGLDANGARTMNLYNEYISSGHWFKIPLNDEEKTWYFVPINYSGDTPVLEYDYLYF